MRIFRRNILLIILVFVLQVIVFSQLELPFVWENLSDWNDFLITSNSHSYSFRKVRGKPTRGNFVLNLKDYGLSEETALRIKQTLRGHFPTHFSKSEEITLNLARNLDQLGLDVGELLEPIIETIVKISENDIDIFIANKTGVKYFAIVITDGEYSVKENLEGLLIKLIKNADKHSSDDAEQFRKNLKALGGVRKANSTLVEILKLAEVKIGKVISHISDIAGFLANGYPNKYRFLLAKLPLRSVYMEVGKYISRGGVRLGETVKIETKRYSKEFVPVIKGKLATYILKNILPKCIELAGGNLENYNLGRFDIKQGFKNLDSIKYFCYELREENISPFSLLKISLPFAYKAAMDLKERHILEEDKQKGMGLVEFRSKEFRDSIYAVEETILFLNQKVKDLGGTMDSVLNDVFESATGRPWWFRNFLWGGVVRFGRFLLGKGIKLDQVLVKSVHAANLASRGKKGSFLANIESIQNLVGKLEDIGVESDEIGKILIVEVPKKAKLSRGNPELFKELLKGIIADRLVRKYRLRDRSRNGLTFARTVRGNRLDESKAKVIIDGEYTELAKFLDAWHKRGMERLKIPKTSFEEINSGDKAILDNRGIIIDLDKVDDIEKLKLVWWEIVGEWYIDKLRTIFNRMAREGVKYSPPEYISELLEGYIKPAKIQETDVVLDVGTGGEGLTAELAAKEKAKLVIGIDISKQQLEIFEERIRKEGIKNIELKVANVLDLPFNNSYFSLVLSSFTLRYLPYELEKIALKELYRVLKSGGRISLLGYSKIGSMGVSPSEPTDEEIYLIDGNEETWREILKEAGFSNIKVSYTAPYGAGNYWMVVSAEK